MSTLALQQQALLAALFDTPVDGAIKNIAACAIHTSARGLKAYQANGHALAERALQAAYPVFTRLLGDESMGQLARAYWHAHPPVCGDVAQWGADLASFLADSPQLRGTPYLPDMARLEWLLHVGASARDAQADAGTWALLATENPDALWLRLAPGTAVLRSAWPVVSMHAAHGDNGPAFEDVGRMLQAGVEEDAVVWRQGFRPVVRVALAGEWAGLSALLRGCSLGQALDAAPELDVSAWLPLAVQSGLLLAVRSGAGGEPSLV